MTRTSKTTRSTRTNFTYRPDSQRSVEKSERAVAAGLLGPAFDQEAINEYLRSFTDDAIRAICDDYRAHAAIDCQIDAEDRAAGRRITASILALWSNPSDQRNLLPVWQRWADNVQGRGMACGHFIPEEAPQALLAELTAFLD